jgi:hypothetical protein
MKKQIFNISAILFAGILMFSCEKWIDPEINKNPNSPTDVPLSLLLPSTQGAIFYAVGGDLSRGPSIWMQHQSGVDRQAYAFDRFQYVESDINNVWNTLNGNALKNLYVMRAKSAESNSPHYAGVSNILTAYVLGEKTDSWGDVPFYEAHRGEQGILTPKYETQQTIYNIIDSLIDASIPQLAVTTSTFSPTAIADLIYKGDRTKWNKLAWTLKLRYKLHLSKRSGYDAALAVLNTAGAAFMSSNADDFQFKFGAAANARSPRFNFNDARGDIRAGKYLVDLMKSTNDPRLPAYFKLNADTLYVGSAPAGQLIAASWMSDLYGAADAFVPVVTFMEFKFMQAEILFNTGNAAGAATAYNEGVAASLTKNNVPAATATTWLAANAAETDATITMEKIMMGKYVALYLQSEVWTDYRRTGFPANLPAPADAVINQIPRRLPYPLDERLYNGKNMPTGQTLTTKLWWDN